MSQLAFLPCLLQAESVEERSRALNEAFTYALFINVCRSLFEAHKLMFSFLLAIKILQNRKEIDPGNRCGFWSSSLCIATALLACCSIAILRDN